eukprot:4537636-Pleurochrysis_carterae.AAC.1
MPDSSRTTARGSCSVSFGMAPAGALMDVSPLHLQTGRIAQSCTCGLRVIATHLQCGLRVISLLTFGPRLSACNFGGISIPLSLDELLAEITSFSFTTFNTDDIANFFTTFNASENALVLSIVVVMVFFNILSSVFAHYRFHRRALGQARVAREKRRAKRMAAKAKFEQSFLDVGQDGIDPTDSGPAKSDSAPDMLPCVASTAAVAAVPVASDVAASASSLRDESMCLNGMLQSRLRMRWVDDTVEVRQEAVRP